MSSMLKTPGCPLPRVTDRINSSGQETHEIVAQERTSGYDGVSNPDLEEEHTPFVQMMLSPGSLQGNHLFSNCNENNRKINKVDQSSSDENSELTMSDTFDSNDSFTTANSNFVTDETCLSEVGQRGRQYLSMSSGYRTGSGGSGQENSLSKSSLQLSQEEPGSDEQKGLLKESCEEDQNSSETLGISSSNASSSVTANTDCSYYILIGDIPTSKKELSSHCQIDIATDSIEKAQLLSPMLPLDPRSIEYSNVPSLHSACYSSNDFERCGRCTEWPCEDRRCQEIKSCLAQLRDPSLAIKELSELQYKVLDCMFKHSSYCDGPRCPFVWCRAISERPGCNSEDNKNILKRHAEGFVDSLSSPYASEKFIKLDASLPYNKLPVRDKDYYALCIMPNSSKSILAKPVRDNNEDTSSILWVIATVSVSERPECELALYTQLRQLQHNGIVKFLWVARLLEVETLMVCHQYVEGCSLQEHLQYSSMGLSSIVSIMYQLVSTTSDLHQHGIIYLNWTSANILFGPPLHPMPHVKLSNFSASILKKELPNIEMEYLRLILPPHLLPPEFLQKCYHVTEAADIWGLGCLLYELLKGRPVWHEHRHLSVDELKEKMKAEPPLPQGVDSSMLDILKQCWKVNSAERVCVEDLGTKLKELNFCHGC